MIEQANGGSPGGIVQTADQASEPGNIRPGDLGVHVKSRFHNAVDLLQAGSSTCKHYAGGYKLRSVAVFELVITKGQHFLHAVLDHVAHQILGAGVAFPAADAIHFDLNVGIDAGGIGVAILFLMYSALEMVVLSPMARSSVIAEPAMRNYHDLFRTPLRKRADVAGAAANVDQDGAQAFLVFRKHRFMTAMWLSTKLSGSMS